MQRARATITYPAAGAPGLITLYTRTTGVEDGGTAQLTVDRLHDALNAGLGIFAGSTSFDALTTVDDIDAATGALTGSHSVTGWHLSGSGSDVYAPLASAIAITWKTSVIVNRRRVRGRTFLSPVSRGAIDSDGTPASGILTAVNAIATAWTDNGLTDTFAVVWHRPKGTSTGSAEDITGHQVKDTFAVLRSRRD